MTEEAYREVQAISARLALLEARLGTAPEPEAPPDMNDIIRGARRSRDVTPRPGERFSDAIRQTVRGDPEPAHEAPATGITGSIDAGTRGEPVSEPPDFGRMLRGAMTIRARGYDPDDYKEPPDAA